MTPCRRWSDHVWVERTTWNHVVYAVCQECGAEAPVQDYRQELP